MFLTLDEPITLIYTTRYMFSVQYSSFQYSLNKIYIIVDLLNVQ